MGKGEKGWWSGEKEGRGGMRGVVKRMEGEGDGKYFSDWFKMASKALCNGRSKSILWRGCPKKPGCGKVGQALDCHVTEMSGIKYMKTIFLINVG